MPNNLKSILRNEKVKEVFKKMKPKKTFLGFISIFLLFIFPEIISFTYGSDITAYCEEKLKQDIPYSEFYLYENIEILLGEGSWLNLIVGIAFLLWLFL